jgi:hypothetical protein
VIAFLSALYFALFAVIASIVGLDPNALAIIGGLGMATVLGYTVGASDKPRRAYRSPYRRLTWQ